MKIYLDLQKQAITKTTDENIYQGDIYSNVFEILFYNYTDSNWFPTMSQLATNGRKAGEFTADALDVVESHEYTEDGVTYLKFDFTMGANWVLMKGRSEFYIWFNRLGGAIVQKKCVGVVNVMIDHSTDDYFIADPTFNPNVKAYIDACIAELGDGSPKYFDTASNIANCTEDKGLAVATDTGHLYYWDETKNSTTKYTDSGLVYNDLSAYYTKTEVDSALSLKADKATTYTKTEADNTFAKKSANNTFAGNNTFNGETTFTNDIEIGGGDIHQVNGGYSTNGNVEAQSITIDGVNLENLFADKTATYTKNETNTLLAQKQDNLTFDSTPTANSTNPVTSGGVKTALDAKADSTTVSGIDNRVGALENEITDLQSVQNVVDVVATKSALNSYDTSKLEENDKIQVIADETHDGASTIYNWNGSAWQYVGAYGTNSYTKAQTYTKTETLEQIDLHKLVNKTYSELATLKSGNNLVPGQLYRITDYVTLTNGMCNNVGNDARSAQHPFDIIVKATATNKFSEQARAIQHASDAYFANSELQAWKLWYCFDNDSNRFEWSDTLTGKGVIYRMIDEFGNDLPYDFKNIQFKRYKITATSDQRQALFVGKYLGFSGNYAVVSDSSDYVWYYTFSKRSDGSDLSLTETTASDIANSYYVKQVIMGQYLTDTPNYRGAQALNNIVMEADNIIVDVQMGAGSHHNTWIGNADIDYCYFSEMFRQNILYGEINHTRADECFERNVMGEGHYSNYTSCWNKFSHHFSQNTSLNLQSNDFENQVGNCKFPEHFTRNHVSNMWDNVNAGTHDTFNRCEFGYMVNVTLSGAGDWDSVKTIMCYNVTIKIANLYGSVFNRMEYVILSQNNSVFNILNLNVGSIFGNSSNILTIALGDLVNINTVYEKRIDWAYNTGTENKSLIYTFASYDATNYIMDNYSQIGTIGDDGTVTWDTVTKFFTKIDNLKMNKTNPTGTGGISMNSGTASGTNSYANGGGATASGNFSNAIGFGATASGSYSTAVNGTATGSSSVAYGNSASASGDGSFALGTMCQAKGNNQIVIGKFNIPDTDSLEIVGNGQYMNTKNARVLDGNGNEFLAGDIYLDTEFTKDENGDLLSKQGMSVKQAIKNIQSALDGNLYNETTDNGIAYEVALSNPLPYGKVNKVGGMSYKSENLLVLTDVAETTVSGVKCKVENGVITINGTATASGNIFLPVSRLVATVQATQYTFVLFSNTTNSNVKVFLGTNIGSFNTEPSFGSLACSNTVVNVTKTLTTSGTVELLPFISGATVGATYDIVVKPMLVLGSTAPTTWSEGFNGIRNTAVSQLIISGNLLKTTIESGAFDNANGTKSSNNKRIRTAEKTSLTAGTYTISFSGVNSVAVYIFDANDVYKPNDSILSWQDTNSLTFTISYNFKVNFLWRKTTNDVITPSDMTSVLLNRGSTIKPNVVFPIPSQIQALDGYGWGISESVCNYIDYDSKKFVQKDGKYTFTGNETISFLNQSAYPNIFYFELPSLSVAVTSNSLTDANYSLFTDFNTMLSNEINSYICGSSSGTRLLFKLIGITTTSGALSELTGKTFHYELATPIETDISQYLTDENYDVLSNLEPNGSIVLDNTYQQEAVYDITTLEKVSV